MAGFGALMLLVALRTILYKEEKPSLYEKKWMLWIVALCTFAPFLANTTGWLVTELGRYPWTVYGLFTIEQSVSPNVSVASLITSNVIYFLLFAGLGSVMVYLVILELRKGPDYEAKKLAKENEPRWIHLIRGIWRMSTLQLLWFVLIGVLFSGFFFLEGFDFGVGMAVQTLAHNDDEKIKSLQQLDLFGTETKFGY